VIRMVLDFLWDMSVSFRVGGIAGRERRGSGPPVAARWRVSGSPCPLRQFAREKITDNGCDLGRMAFEREMSGFEKVNLGVWIVPL